MVDTRVEPEDEGSVPEGSRQRATPTPESRGPSILRSAVEWLVVLGGALVVALVIRTFLFATFWIPSASMHPTLLEKDRVIVNKLSYKVHDVHRGDIVVFSKPPGESDITENGRQVKDLIKRVVGLPGETVSLRNGKVLVDGKVLAEPYLPRGTRTEPICDLRTSFEVPEGAVFVMGDNRANSKDARCFRDHSIRTSSIVGRAFVRIWPFSRFDGL